MPPYKEAPPGIVNFWIDFACRWYASHQLLVMVLRQQELVMVMKEEMTQTSLHGENAPWQNCFKH